MYFTYSDVEGGIGSFAGSFVITEPADTSDFEDYVFYWGSSDTSVHTTARTPFGSISKTSAAGGFISLITGIESVPSITPTHILLFVRQGSNINSVPIAAPFVDDRGGSSDPVPSDHTDIRFQYSDLNGADSNFEAALVIDLPATDSDFQEYVAYWGESETDIHPGDSSPIGSIDKSLASAGSISLAVTDRVIPSSPSPPTHILVFVRKGLNLNPTPIHAPLNDNGEASSDGVPSNHADLSFEYADSDSTSGSFQSSLDITVPASVDDFQDYVAYWGESDSTIHQGSSSPIGEVAKESASAGSIALPITLRSIPVSPSAPTHILVFVRQGLNLNSIPISAPLKDNGVGSSGGEPSDHTDLYFKYTDQNSGTGLFLGSFQIREPADISDFERYVFYLGSSETTIHPESSSPIVTKSKLSSSGTINFVMDLALDFSSFAVSPTHLLAYVRQGLNLNPTAIVAPFVDNRGGSSDGVPVDHSDLGFEYSDTNGADGVFESNLVISVPATDSDFQEYVAYWGESSSVVHSASSDVIGSIDKSFASAGSISLSIASSSIPASPTTTHILVFLRNGLNLNPTPVAAPLNDNGVGSSGGIPDDHSDLYFTYEDSK